MLKPEVTTPAPLRLPLVDALRAVAATIIAWHHFAAYGPSDWSVPALSLAFEALQNCQWAAQVFFVVSGYVMAQSMARRDCNARQVGVFAVRRYCRLGLPYLATIGLVLWACAIARGTLSEDVIGPPPTLPQILAHVVFLQDILGYESLSAGFWFVCIDFQLGLLYVLMLFLGSLHARSSGSVEGEQSGVVPVVLGWALAVPAMFYFNLQEDLDVWAIYFFGQFFLGVMVYHGLKNSRWTPLLVLYFLLMTAALVYEWRSRMAAALLTGLILAVGGKTGLMESWPASRVVAYLGRTSYSLFLIHFPVFVVVWTVWTKLDETSSWSALAGLIVAYVASLIATNIFFRVVEAPSARLARKFS